MCEGVAILVEGGSETRLMEEVTLILVRGRCVILVDEEGREKRVEGFSEIRVDMLRHEIRIAI